MLNSKIISIYLWVGHSIVTVANLFGQNNKSNLSLRSNYIRYRMHLCFVRFKCALVYFYRWIQWDCYFLSTIHCLYFLFNIYSMYNKVRKYMEATLSLLTVELSTPLYSLQIGWQPVGRRLFRLFCVTNFWKVVMSRMPEPAFFFEKVRKLTGRDYAIWLKGLATSWH